MPTLADANHLLALEGLDRDTLTGLLDASEAMLPAVMDRAAALDPAPLAGRIIANLFFEDSTRTRTGFTIAAHRLGASTVDLTRGGSSMSKGETLVDTALNIEAMGVDAMIVRTPASGGAAMVAAAVACPVVNAGDGRHEHPTQGLLDLLTLRQAWGTVAGRTVAIVGDIAGSRVARSNLHALTTMGANVTLVGPPVMVPGSFASITRGPGAVTITHDFDAVLDVADAVMMLRVQFERGSDVTSDYRDGYGLTESRLQRLRPEVVVLHPGPVNRGLEMDDAAVDDRHRSRILRQVTNGVAVRMAVLAALVR